MSREPNPPSHKPWSSLPRKSKNGVKQTKPLADMTDKEMARAKKVLKASSSSIAFRSSLKKEKEEIMANENEIETPQVAGWAKIRGSFQSVEDVRVGMPAGLYSLDLDEGKKLYTPVKNPSDLPTDLPGLPSKYLLDQIKLFWERADRYQKYHLLQKRGILLYGEPGCGKTSIINLLSQDLVKMGGVIFMIDDFETASACIQHFRTIEPARPIMTLMEDIEGVFKGDQGNREVKAALSLLDGQDQVNNIVHIACPDPDTRILKADLTWIRAGDLKMGEELVAFDETGKDRKYRTAKVSSAHVIQKPKFLVKTSLGEIVVSEKHPFLVRMGVRQAEWRIVDDLKIGNRILSVGLPVENRQHTRGRLSSCSIRW